jgi:hypothetical protein
MVADASCPNRDPACFSTRALRARRASDGSVRQGLAKILARAIGGPLQFD